MPDIVTFVSTLTAMAKAATSAMKDLAAASDLTPATREVAGAGSSDYGISGGGGKQTPGTGYHLSAVTLTPANLVAELRRAKEETTR